MGWPSIRSHVGPRIRGLVKVNSGAAGIGIGITEGLWLLERLKALRTESNEEDLGVLVWGWAAWKKLREARTLNTIIFMDTDPASEIRYRRAKQVFDQLKMPSTWVKIPGPTAGQNPMILYERLRKDKEVAAATTAALEWTSKVVDLGYVQTIQLSNSMHGTGMGVNAFIAEELPKIFSGDFYKLMLAINADISRVTSKLDYLESTKWSLNKLDELLARNALDAVIAVDNTVASAVKSVWLDIVHKEELKKAWLKFLKTEDLYEAIARFYSIIARLAKLDPHETNDLIVQATAPLTIVPAWGVLVERQEREIRASSAPWDYYNIRRVTKGKYIVPGYLPSEQLQKIDFKTIASELAIATLTPLDPTTVTNIIVVLGEEDREIWESQGISMYTTLEKSFMDVGYNGPLDILTLPRESGVWIYAVVDNMRVLEAKFELRPWR